MRALLPVVLPAVLLTGAASVACSSSTPARSAFDAVSAGGCLRHQTNPPNSADRSAADLARGLVVLRYYTAHGQENFCDGKPATTTDLTWMRLYVSQGADASHVARWLGQG